jgi:dolichol kinase
MDHALAVRPVALQIHALLKDLDTSRWRDGIEAAARRRIAEIDAALGRLLARNGAPAPLSMALKNLAQLLSERLPHSGLPASELRVAWARYRDELQLAYEALRKSLSPWRVELPSVRPTNYTRSIFHALVSIALVVWIEEGLSARGLWLTPLCFAASFWLLEGLRHKSKHARAFLLWLFGPIAHPHERYRVNSSTWFATALTILGLFFEPIWCVVGIAVVGLADPAAANIGRRWGKTRLSGQRSLEGSIAFVITGALAAFAALAIWHADIGLYTRIAIAFGGALAGALAELGSRRLDDNFTVPLAAALGAWLTFLAIG